MKLKLWHKTLLSLGITSAIFSGPIIGFSIYAKSLASGDIGHISQLSLKNNLQNFKNIQKYKSFFVDPVTNKQIATFDYATNTINGAPVLRWINDYERRTKKTPTFIVRGGPTEFRNFYSDAIFPKTFIKFVAWFAKEVPWGPDLASLSYFKISKGIKKDNEGKYTLGNFSTTRHRTKRIEFSPDSFYGESPITDFLIRFTEKPISKAEIPALIKAINQTNRDLIEKYGEDKWAPHAVRLYSLQKIGNKYMPIVTKNGNLTTKIGINSPLELEKVSDIDVVWDSDTMTVKTINRDAYKLNIDKQLTRIQIWKSLFGKEWKGLSFDWLKYLTHHEYGHMQTMGFVNNNVNRFVSLNIPSNIPTSLLNSYDLDLLNLYLQARAPQLRALKASVNLRKNGSGWDWDFYVDRLADWKAGRIKIKPDPRDYDQVAFEYKSDGSIEWTRETIEEVFGTQVDPGDPTKAPFIVDIIELYKNIKAGKKVRFFTYSFRDAKAFAKKLKIPVATLYLFNTFDNLLATKNPGLSSSRSVRLSARTLILANDDRVGRFKYLNANGKFVHLEDILLEIEAYNHEKVLLDNSDRSKRTFFQLASKLYRINPKARDKEGKLLTKSASQLKILLQSIAIAANDASMKGNVVILNLLFRVGGSSSRTTSIAVRPSFKNAISRKNLKKWSQFVSAGNDENIRDVFSSYVYNFSEVLTRDWVQITQTKSKESVFNYNSALIPINNKYFGFETYIDPSLILDKKVGDKNQPDKTIRQSLDMLYIDPNFKKTGLDLKTEFIKKIIDYISKRPEKVNKILMKAFVNATQEIIGSKAADFLKSMNNLSFLNIERIKSRRGYKPTKPYTLMRAIQSKGSDKYEDFFNALGSYTRIVKKNNGYYRDRWQRSSLAPSRADEGTEKSWVLYNDDGQPTTYNGDLKNISGNLVKTRPEAYWTFFLKARGVGLRTVSALWLSPERDAVAMWGYLPLAYENKVRYLQFKNVKTGAVKRKLVNFNVDNLFYYNQAPGHGNKRTLSDEGFTSWNIDYVTMGTWVNSFLTNGAYEMNFIDANGKIVEINWRGQKLAMTGNGIASSETNTERTSDQIISLNWYSKTFAPVYIEQNKIGQNIINVKDQFPI